MHVCVRYQNHTMLTLAVGALPTTSPQIDPHPTPPRATTVAPGAALDPVAYATADIAARAMWDWDEKEYDRGDEQRLGFGHLWEIVLCFATHKAGGGGCRS
ncbi:hypothetical protein GUJ93_ZPchr0001g29896 [Zizania palustris]|uniref:Uncharacterized protein n=1 Tax=Zizania palustris TaxID=103762 RepID=A0A8J5S9F0_ZIZPA|nr:hypothetical protein GUJ93_ZPchr0001g29896 [Zizania palustris]